MKVIILCGGDGIRLKNQLHYLPKALIPIDHKPIIWHIMKRYSLYGYTEFILALGKYGNLIRDYFYNYNLYTNDIKFALGKSEAITSYNVNQEENWQITLINTGEFAGTGARLYRCKDYLNEKYFLLTYADCLSNIDIEKSIKQHLNSQKIATISGVMPPYRYGEFTLKNNKVISYEPVSKLSAFHGFVNGGYMVLNTKIFKFLSSYNECILENEVFEELVKKEEIDIYKHKGFWQCLDNDREYEYLKKLCDQNERTWLKK